MKLKCKILNKYMKQILEGKKKVEHRQVESIIFVDEDGKEYEFEVKDVKKVSNDYSGLVIREMLKQKYPDVPWDDDLLTITIELGREIK